MSVKDERTRGMILGLAFLAVLVVVGFLIHFWIGTLVAIIFVVYIGVAFASVPVERWIRSGKWRN